MDKSAAMNWEMCNYFPTIRAYKQAQYSMNGQFDHDIIIGKSEELKEIIEKPWSMQIIFSDGSNPIVYNRKTAKEIGELIKEWSVNYYLNMVHSQLMSDNESTNWLAFTAALKENGIPELIFDVEE